MLAVVLLEATRGGFWRLDANFENGSGRGVWLMG